MLGVTSQEAHLVSTYGDGVGKSVGLDYWRSDCDRDVGRGLQQPEFGAWQTGFLLTVAPKWKSQPVNLPTCRGNMLTLADQGALCILLPHFGLQMVSLLASEAVLPPCPAEKLVHSPAYC